MKVPVLVLSCVLCNVSAQILLKFGAIRGGPDLYQDYTSLSLWWKVLASPQLVGGIILWTVSTLLWVYVLTGVNLSYAYGLYGLNYIFTPIAGHLVFKESLTPTQLAGMALITLGVGLTVTGKVHS